MNKLSCNFLLVKDLVKLIIKNDHSCKKLSFIKPISILGTAKSGIQNMPLSVESSMESLSYAAGNLTDGFVNKVPNQIGLLTSTAKCAARLTTCYLNFRSGKFFSGTLNGISGVLAASSLGFRCLSNKLSNRQFAFSCYLVSLGLGICSDVLDGKEPTIMYLRSPY